MSQVPVFRELDRAECDAVLASQMVGRLAFTFRDRVDIEPLHFVYVDGVVYGRTQPGVKVEVLAHHPWVAFEVDDVRALFTWRSVVVHGRIEFPAAHGSPAERAKYQAGVDAFRRLVPQAFAEGDPTPERSLVFALPVAELSGRAAAPGEAR